MVAAKTAPTNLKHEFPPFDLTRLLKTVFNPAIGEKVCVLIDLDDIKDVIDFKFLKNKDQPVQEKAHRIFYQGIRSGLMKELNLGACDFFAYKTTGGSNLELSDEAMSPDGKLHSFEKEIYLFYDIILCISTFSATAPLTAAAKRFGFRGGTLHGVNDTILNSGLAVDYNEVSKETELLRKGMTGADSVDIDFVMENQKCHLHIDLGGQEAQKSHGICRVGPDIANLPAGEVYFVPKNAKGTFPIKFEDGTLAILHVEDGRIHKAVLVEGDKKVVKDFQRKLDIDPASGILGELGFGTQVLPYSGSDIQDEKIFGTFHLATGRNDHLGGNVVLKNFHDCKNATHDDILFSSTKTPEITLKQLRLNIHGKSEVLIENYEPCEYLLNLIHKTR